jgi:hypothetical protein
VTKSTEGQERPRGHEQGVKLLTPGAIVRVYPAVVPVAFYLATYRAQPTSNQQVTSAFLSKLMTPSRQLVPVLVEGKRFLLYLPPVPLRL